MTPRSLLIGMSKKTTTASLTINSDGENNSVLFTSKIPGIFGNRISVKIVINDRPGPPTCEIDGLDITYRLPSSHTFEASGPFYYNGNAVEGFGTLWFAGEFNGKESWALDGLPVTWPLVRDGEFMLHAEDSWHMIKRVSGAELMHWQADSNADNVILIPDGAYGPGNLEAWRGIAPLCTGYIDSHYGIDATQAQYLPAFTEGIEGIVVGSAEVVALLTVAIPDGQTGTASLTTTSRKQLDGGF